MSAKAAKGAVNDISLLPEDGPFRKAVCLVDRTIFAPLLNPSKSFSLTSQSDFLYFFTPFLSQIVHVVMHTKCREVQ